MLWFQNNNDDVILMLIGTKFWLNSNHSFQAIDTSAAPPGLCICFS